MVSLLALFGAVKRLSVDIPDPALDNWPERYIDAGRSSARDGLGRGAEVEIGTDPALSWKAF
jgi:hypothetical protein